MGGRDLVSCHNGLAWDGSVDRNAPWLIMFINSIDTPAPGLDHGPKSSLPMHISARNPLEACKNPPVGNHSWPTS